MLIFFTVVVEPIKVLQIHFSYFDIVLLTLPGIETISSFTKTYQYKLNKA